MKSWILVWALAVGSSGEELASTALVPSPAPAVESPAAPVTLPEPLSLAAVVRELLAQLTPYERSRFFERHPGLKRAVNWKERPPEPRLVIAEGDGVSERERRESEYHIRLAEPPSISSAPATVEPDRASESAKRAEILIERMEEGFPDTGMDDDSCPCLPK